MGAAAGEPPLGVGDEGAGARDDTEQVGRVGADPAADAGSDRRAQAGLWASSGAGAGGGVRSTSGRMSIRQPVNRAASRAFWPSLPMASESW